MLHSLSTVLMALTVLPSLRRSVPGLIAADVSYYQKVVSGLYRRRWLIFRALDGTWEDPNCADNLRWSLYHAGRRHWARGFDRLYGFTVYVVFRPGQNSAAALIALLGPSPSPFLTVMVDVETWRDKNGVPQIAGDQSVELNAQLAALVHWLGDRRRVIVYGNAADLAELFPGRPPWVHVQVAKYSSVAPVLDGPGQLLGWQYTDGTDTWPAPAGLPKSSAPFGRCDHNVFPGHTPQTLCAALGLDPAQPAPKIRPPRPRPRRKRARPVLYVVRRGDTLAAIAAGHNSTVRELIVLNARRHPHLATDPDFIKTGWKVRVR